MSGGGGGGPQGELRSGAHAGKGRGRAQSRRAPSAPVADRTNWTLARLAEEITSREGAPISQSQLSEVLCKKGFRWRQPRHTRQDPDAINRAGLRLKLRRMQTEAGDIVLPFCDESESLTHPYLDRTWAKRGADLRVLAPVQTKKMVMTGTLDWTERKLIVTTSRTKRISDFIAHLQVPDRLYGPKPGMPIQPVVIVLDNGPIHVRKATLAALAERALLALRRVLPKHALELNDIEVVWGDLKAHQPDFHRLNFCLAWHAGLLQRK
jgi:hypothetical protein